MNLRTSFFTIGGGDESNWTMMTHPDLSDGDAYLFPSTTHNLLVYNARGTKIFKTDLTNITFLADLPVSSPDGVCYNNATNQLVLLDEGWYKDTVSYVSTDTDLSTYTTGALPTDAYRTGAQLNGELIYGNGYYVIGGEYNPSSSARQPAIFYSTNGISWTRLIFNTSTSITTGTVKVLGFGNNKFVAFGSYFTGTTDYSSKAVAGSTPTSWTKAKSDFSGHIRIKNYPHLFVLSCLMDRQIKAERAWSIPGRVAQEIGSYRLEDMAKVSLEEYKNIFNKLKLHRFNDVQAGCFYNGVQKIMKDYQGNAANIWNNEPSSATVVRRFLEFDGAGIKIATMATNILARQYKIKLSDFYSIDISPDVHVKRIFYRTGLIDKKDKDNIDMIIYKAREIYPQFPGLIDFACWEIGRNWCTERKALCSECPLNEHCKKNI